MKRVRLEIVKGTCKGERAGAWEGVFRGERITEQDEVAKGRKSGISKSGNEVMNWMERAR